MSNSCVFIGSGGHAKAVKAILDDEMIIDAIVSFESELPDCFHGVRKFTTDNDVIHGVASHIGLINGVGSLPGQEARQRIFEYYKNAGFKFLQVLSDKAITADDVYLSEGVQVFAGAIINCGARIGANSIVNSGAIVEHDVDVGRHCHLAPGSVICGDVCIKDNVHIGAGAVVIQGVEIGEGAVIGAGATVVRNVQAGQRVIGSKPEYATNHQRRNV